MHYTTSYHSPLGEMFLASTNTHLTGLWFKDQKYFMASLPEKVIHLEDHTSLTSVLYEGIRWLDLYFSGTDPQFVPPIQLAGTRFQMDVWEILRYIPYGKTMTYGEIASILAKQRRIPSMSAQAVGNAVGHNPVPIMIPCHRVIGSNGSLTGYAGGIERKRALLTFENVLLH